MARSKKPEISNLNVFYILYTLMKYTDEEHALTAGEIAKRVNQNYGSLTESGRIISEDTVKRILENMINYIFPEDSESYENTLQTYGYYIHTAMKKGTEFVPYREPEEKRAPVKYFYLENDLKPTELLILKDSIEAYNYLGDDNIAVLVQKIMRINPRMQELKNEIAINKTELHAGRPEVSSLLSNIEELNRIIQDRKCAKIIYGAWAYDAKSKNKKKLVARKGYDKPKVIQPVRLIWSNGYYYLIIYNFEYKNLTNLRVDRIMSIEETDRKAVYKETIKPTEYRYKHPVMYRGDAENITMLWKDENNGRDYFMNKLMDMFGPDMKVRPATDQELNTYLKHDRAYYAKEGIKWYRVSAEASPDGTGLWLTQCCEDCIVISPESLVKEIRERLKKGVKNYKF